jgi:hypothetical protein
MTKDNLRLKAIELRKKGYSYSYIKSQISVSKGTLSEWLSAVPYKANEEMLSKMKKARDASAFAKKQSKQESFDKAKIEGEKDIGTLSTRDFFMLGIGLYLGEGAKTGEDIRIINSNPAIIYLAIAWFKRSCGLSDEHFRIRLHLYPDSNVDECLSFWSKTTNIHISRFYKTQIDLRKDKKLSNKAKLPYGTAHLSVRSNGKKEFGVFLARKIKVWMDLVLKNAGMV